MKLISVIIPVYNEPLEYIKKSIESMQDQTYKSIELIIIVDNPERDELVKMIKSIGAKDKRVVVLVNEKNIGLTASLNKALDVARGEFIARMDADDISFRDRLEVQLNYIENNNLDIVGCNVVNIDEFGADCGHSNYPISDEIIKKYLKLNSAIPHPTWLVKKSVFDRDRYIDFASCEDYGFLVNSVLRGYKLGNVRDCKLKYRRNPNGVSSTRIVQQKTGMHYLRDNYRHGRISDYCGYTSFMDSSAGIKKAKALGRYYKSKKRIKYAIASKKRVGALFMLVSLMLWSGEARGVLVNRIRKKYLINKHKEDF